MDALLPEALPPGTRLGSWRVQGRAGYGTYGAVYRAHKKGWRKGPVVALKLARFPEDPRFDREAELLSRIQHPSVPRLLGRGTWSGSREGEAHPFLVMQWVEGLRLYDWAKDHPQPLDHAPRLLAQVARALAATHACQGLHRDVKGDNVMVSPDGRAFLMDFGCGTWKGAASLTEGVLAPGTRNYRSPQALRFHWDHRRSRGIHYEATPADDVYALGVTAYRLCTGVYPPLATDPSLVGDDGRETLEALVPPGRLTPMAPELEHLILRMLSENPQDRGSAVELAAALEAVAATSGKVSASRGPRAMSLKRARPQVAWLGRGLALPMLAGCLAFGLIVLLAGHLNFERQWAPPSIMSDGGTRGVADAAVEELPASSWAPESEPEGVSLEMLKEPLPGQRRPPCPRDQINIRGGCWVEVAKVSPPCGEVFYDWKGSCYAPVAAPRRPSTSDNP
ncbi:serine/threonine-protein kinase [Stigmatella erecta]|uniref:non-specific serine/threonine protein kinase n=1 Tax=Stigmatella erecta TaxID=83460 RepID=A0A1I0I472_9BACT|nr:serine/threonine-protein kinase [Stigmatella erecta]SET91406.1 Serine/threonine protein kinase [Stigmatella erecta]